MRLALCKQFCSLLLVLQMSQLVDAAEPVPVFAATDPVAACASVACFRCLLPCAAAACCRVLPLPVAVCCRCRVVAEDPVVVLLLTILLLGVCMELLPRLSAILTGRVYLFVSLCSFVGVPELSEPRDLTMKWLLLAPCIGCSWLLSSEDTLPDEVFVHHYSPLILGVAK